MIKKLRAEIINDRARKLQEQGKLQEAIALFQEASALAPKWSVPLYNLGLLFKNERNWQECLEYNRRATALDAKNQAAWWNLGIAATALSRWDIARAAWRGFGVDVPQGDGPVDLPCGFCPIRLDPHGNAEVVWASRIDPARAVLDSIPFPESKHRWKDVVLNDGAPNGYRKYQGQDVPVFNAIQLLEASPFGTYVARVKMPGEREDLARLAEVAGEQQGHAEDWTTSTRIICRACSEGRPHELHDQDMAPADGMHLIGIAARSRQHASEMLSAWESEREDIRVESLDDALEPGA